MRRTTAAALLLLTAVIFAPTLRSQTTVTIGASQDNTLYQSSSGSLSNGSGSRMFTGVTDNGAKRRAVVAFDLSSAIPACATVTSASLQLRMVMTQAGPVNVGLHRLTTSWGEAGSVAGSGQGAGGQAATGDATWMYSYYPGTAWSTVGGDFVATSSASLSVGGNGSYVWSSPQLAADVQSWANTPSSNFGWILLTPENMSQTAKAFATREQNTIAWRPSLTVTFTSGPNASVSVTGTGCIGSSGQPLTLSATGVPALGSTGFAIDINGAPASSTALIFLASGVGSTPLPISPSCFVYLDLPSALTYLNLGISPLSLPLSSSGSITLPLAIGFDCGLVGQSLALQIVVMDTVGPITSEALTLNFGV